MKNMKCNHLNWIYCFFFASITLASASQIQDDFSGASLDSNLWGAAHTGGASAPYQVGGILTTTVGETGQNQRSLIYSVRTDLDFTAKPITLSANIAFLGGAGAETQPVNRYLLIGSFGEGSETMSRYYPGSELPYGVWLSAGQTNGVNYLEVGTVQIGKVSTTRTVYTGKLTSMSLTLNGVSYSVSASGTDEFSMGPGNSFTGMLENFHPWEYKNHFRFAMGAANSYQGAVTVGATAGWDSVAVTPGPGPAP